MSIKQNNDGGTSRSEWERVEPDPSDVDLGYPGRETRGHIGVLNISQTGETVIYDKEDSDAWIQASNAVDVGRSDGAGQTEEET